MRLKNFHRPQKGFSLSEMLVATGMLGILAAAGFTASGFRGMELAMAQDELRGSLEQAFILARAQGRNVTVAMRDEGRTDVLPLRLPKKIQWGKPASIPLPPGLDTPKQAAVTGEAHPAITVTPRRTATAALWFLNDGEEAICMRLNGHGNILMYRWRRELKRWVKA